MMQKSIKKQRSSPFLIKFWRSLRGERKDLKANGWKLTECQIFKENIYYRYVHLRNGKILEIFGAPYLLTFSVYVNGERVKNEIIK